MQIFSKCFKIDIVFQDFMKIAHQQLGPNFSQIIMLNFT